ncbi:MAG: hypothetical protein QOE51_4817 [Actinoplanes sp.]|nr:hypothetical protein [Actinoplanes sp.]
MYALLFADAGLTATQISTLFVVWSVVSFAAEIPSGAWADVWSRRRLYAVGAFLTAAGFASWTFWPTYAGFAMGFVLWGLGGALCSGTLEALLYDALGDSETYARTAGRGGTTAILAMLAATLLASPAYTLGGYLLVGALSVAIRAVGGFVALTLPEPTRTHPTQADPTQAEPARAEPAQAEPAQAEPAQAEPAQAEPAQAEPTQAEPTRADPTQAEPTRAGPTPADPTHAAPTPTMTRATQTPSTPTAEPTGEVAAPGYLATLRAGLSQVRGSRRLAGAVAIAALVPGFTALDEYLPLLSRAAGAATAIVPLIFALPAVAMAIGSSLAGRWSRISAGRLAAALAVAALLLAGGALSARLAGMLPIAAAFGILQFAIIVTETRLQDAITGPARTTVLSVAGFAAEVFAVVLYAGFGAGAELAPIRVLVACCAVPLLLTAAVTATQARTTPPP